MSRSRSEAKQMYWIVKVKGFDHFDRGPYLNWEEAERVRAKMKSLNKIAFFCRLQNTKVIVTDYLNREVPPLQDFVVDYIKTEWLRATACHWVVGIGEDEVRFDRLPLQYSHDEQCWYEACVDQCGRQIKIRASISRPHTAAFLEKTFIPKPE